MNSLRRWAATAALVVVVGASGGAVLAAPTPPLKVTIAINDHGFPFNSIGLRAKHIRAKVINKGTQPHALAVAKRGDTSSALVKTKRLGPGQSAQLEIDLPPGDYMLYSPVDNDRAHGLSVPMQIMAVTSAGAEANRVFYNYLH